MNMIIYNHSQAKRLNWTRERMVKMEEMGMTDKQFNYFLRTMIEKFRLVENQLDDKKEAQKTINKIIDDLQKTIED